MPHKEPVNRRFGMRGGFISTECHVISENIFENDFRNIFMGCHLTKRESKHKFMATAAVCVLSKLFFFWNCCFRSAARNVYIRVKFMLSWQSYSCALNCDLKSFHLAAHMDVVEWLSWRIVHQPHYVSRLVIIFSLPELFFEVEKFFPCHFSLALLSCNK